MTARIVWGYASDHEDESWFGCCSTREEAIAEAPGVLELHTGDAFWIAQGTYPDLGLRIPDLQLILDHIRESLADVANVDGQEIKVADGAGAALNEALERWARSFLSATKWVMATEPERVVYATAAEAPPEPKFEEATSTTANGAASTEVKEER